MTDRTDPAHGPSSRGPWTEVTELNQIFDHGAPWCINADGHPEYDYPDPEIHVPPFECRTIGLALDAMRDLDGPPLVIEAYVARPFRFGEPRESRGAAAVRLVVEATDADGEVVARLSVSLGDGLRLARYLLRVVDLVDHPPRR